MRWIVTVLLIAWVFLGCSGGDFYPPPKHPARVLLWGDSIRVGYEPSLVAMAEGDLAIWSPEWYFGMTVESLRDRLYGSERPSLATYDAFHLNAGLHDALVGGPTSSVLYEQAWREVIAVIQAENPDARIILTTSTLPPLSTFPETVGVVLEYNEVIRSLVAEGPGLWLDDLASVQGIEGLETEDGLHFSAEDSEVLAVAVYIAIQGALL